MVRLQASETTTPGYSTWCVTTYLPIRPQQCWLVWSTPLISEHHLHFQRWPLYLDDVMEKLYNLPGLLPQTLAKSLKQRPISEFCFHCEIYCVPSACPVLWGLEGGVVVKLVGAVGPPVLGFHPPSAPLRSLVQISSSLWALISPTDIVKQCMWKYFINPKKKKNVDSTLQGQLLWLSSGKREKPPSHSAFCLRRYILLIEKEMSNFVRPAPWRQQLPGTVKQNFYPNGQKVLTHSCWPQSLTRPADRLWTGEGYLQPPPGTGVSEAAAFAGVQLNLEPQLSLAWADSGGCLCSHVMNRGTCMFGILLAS